MKPIEHLGPVWLDLRESRVRDSSSELFSDVGDLHLPLSYQVICRLAQPFLVNANVKPEKIGEVFERFLELRTSSLNRMEKTGWWSFWLAVVCCSSYSCNSWRDVWKFHNFLLSWSFRKFGWEMYFGFCICIHGGKCIGEVGLRTKALPYATYNFLLKINLAQAALATKP